MFDSPVAINHQHTNHNNHQSYNNNSLTCQQEGCGLDSQAWGCSVWS